MGDNAEHFRNRAKDCLNLSKGARHMADRVMLEDIAADLNAEARKMEEEERLRTLASPRAQNVRRD